MVLVRVFTVGVCVALAAGVAAAADIYTEDQYRSIISTVLTHFWGNAKLSDGSFVQPASDEDRRTLPIPHPEAKRVVDFSVTAGVAVWCGFDHVPYYTVYMRVERQRKIWSDKQIAFVGFLFGVAQGMVERSLQNRPCDDTSRSKAAAALKANTEYLQRLLR